MTQKKQQNTPQPPYLFEHVFRNLISRFWLNVLKPEIENIKKIYTSKTIPFSSELFEVFPRSNIFYKQMLFDLAGISNYNVTSCLNFLFAAIGNMAMNKKSRAFDSVNNSMPNDLFSAEIILKTKKLLLTDLICTIVSKMDNMEQQSAKNLITCGIYFCMSQSQKDDFPMFLLKQWSVIFSYISILSPNELFDRLTQIIINKYDLFFSLMRYIRLDKTDHANDIAEIMTGHLKRAMRKNILTSSMFISLSTLLSTYYGSSSCIKKIYQIAKAQISNSPTDNPGAVDLIVTLFRFKELINDDIDQEAFFEKNVYPLTKISDGILSAARSFRALMFNHNLPPDFFCYVWSPIKRTNSFDFLTWDVKYDLNELTKKFNEHFFPSPYLNRCSKIIVQIIVRLAAMDFKNFRDNIFPNFVNSDIDIDSPQFKVFVNIVPMINDEQFMKLSNGISKDDVDQFNAQFANTTNTKIKDIINSLQGYTLHISDDYKNKAAKANKTNRQNQTVLDAFNKLNIDIGIETNFQEEEIKVQKDRDNNSNKVVRVIPFLVNSKMFLTKEWMESFIRLSALSDEEVSKLAYSICQSIFQQEERRKEFLDVLIMMSLQVDQKMEVLYMCISMLIEITDLLEPNTPKDDKAEEYNIEFVALIGLASSYPALRSIAYELLIRANKLLQNQGLYSQIEDHIPAIESNVNHNIMLQAFPKRPGKNEYTEDIFSFSNLLYSNYQEPWLFFLAEFGRVITYSKYNPLLKRIKEHCHKFSIHIEQIDDKKHHHLDLGLLSLFISTCTIKEFSENNLFVYEIPVKPIYTIESFSEELLLIINNCFKYNKLNLVFKAIKHVNYTVVPLIFKIIRDILKQSAQNQEDLNSTNSMSLSDLFCNVLPSIHLMFAAIEGTKIVIKQVQPIVVEIYLIICSDKNTMSLFQKNIETTNESEFRKSQNVSLCFLTLINFCMECYIQITATFKNNNLFTEKKSKAAELLWGYLCFLLKLNVKKHPKFMTVKTYAAWVLHTIVNKASKIIPMCKEPEIKTISNCERYGYNVLYPLLKTNTCGYFKFFANSCFRRKGLMADAFFSAIYQQVFELDRGLSLVSDFYNQNAGMLLLLGILRFKTGSPYSKNFLEKYIEIYPPHKKSSSSDKKPSIEEILKEPADFFDRICEQVVQAALEQMKDKKFKGTIKVMVDILKKWIMKFRLLPNQKACIPSKVTYNVYTITQFLNDLMEITIKYRFNHDFQRIVDLWATLLKVKDNQYTVPVFITEYSTDKDRNNEKELREKDTHTELKCELFKLLLEDRTMTIIPKTLAKRCKFGYYAYVTYQKKKDLDNEFWIVEVLITALKKSPEYMVNFLPELIHFAILFHSNQTQALLKRLCKKYNVLYTRRTLSTISIQNLVTEFNEIIKEIDDKRMEDFEKKQNEEVANNETKAVNFPHNLQNGLDFVSDPEKSYEKYSPRTTTIKLNKSTNIDKKGFFYSEDQAITSAKMPPHCLQRSATPTTISRPFSIQSNTHVMASDDSSIILDSSLTDSSPNDSSATSTDDEFQIQTTDTIIPASKVPKRTTGALLPIHSKSTPPNEKKKKRSLNTKWAKEAMRWTIGTQNLRLAYMSIIILNSLKIYEISARYIRELLIGVCKSTAYFLSTYEHIEDKSLLYDFIDEAFKLFKIHFVGNEMLAYNFIESFLSFVVSVDAYFENMLPLFERCLTSEVTEKEAQPKLLEALRPYFNELESDSTARAAFSNFEKKATTNAIDIKFVKIVLRRAMGHKSNAQGKKRIITNDEDDLLLIKQATNEQLNRAFLHYSLMVGNASADLKRRIFTISSKIIEEIQNRRTEDNSNNAGPKATRTNKTDEISNSTNKTDEISNSTNKTDETNISNNTSTNKADDTNNTNNTSTKKTDETNISNNTSTNKTDETNISNNTSTNKTDETNISNNTSTNKTDETNNANEVEAINSASNKTDSKASPFLTYTTDALPNTTPATTATTTTIITTVTAGTNDNLAERGDRQKEAAVTPNTATMTNADLNLKLKNKSVSAAANTNEEEADKNDLNAQALLVIFKKATNSLPWMKEAIDFIRVLSIFYPLLSTVPDLNDFSWGHDAKIVIEKIDKFAPKETMNVSLVNCSNLNSLSLLLTVKINDKKESKIKVLPFSSILDTFSPKHSGFEDLTKKVLKVSTEFKNKFLKSISPKADYFITGHWKKIEQPTAFIKPEAMWLNFKMQKKKSPLLSVDEFLALEDV